MKQSTKDKLADEAWTTLGIVIAILLISVAYRFLIPVRFFTRPTLVLAGTVGSFIGTVAGTFSSAMFLRKKIRGIIDDWAVRGAQLELRSADIRREMIARVEAERALTNANARVRDLEDSLRASLGSTS